MERLVCHYPVKHWKFLRKLARACAEEGGRACLVGGCVRSALLGEEVEDFDVEVFGIEPERLEKLLSGLHRVARVGKAFGIFKLPGLPIDVGLPRSERKAGSGHRGFTITIDPNLSLKEAARRRDFTVNALYFDISREQIEDPLGGLKDLDERCLRHCSDRFPEDPLRVLRAMQFAARMPAEVATETIRLCRTLTPEGLSPERFFAEWEKLLLKGKEPSKGLFFLRECGWLKYFPELEELDGCPQDPEWHPEGDVFTHTAHCLDAAAPLRTGMREDDLVLGFAVLCHDMGKASTTEKVDGRIRSYGHETAGLEPARRFMERLNVANRIIEQVLPLVKCHMRPAMLHVNQSSPAAIQRLARDAGRLDLLLKVYRADAAGRPPLPDDSSETVLWLQDQARRLDVENKRPKPLLNGRDLLARGWESGPAMGSILRDAYERQLDGEFAARRDALEWLDTQLAGPSPPRENQRESAKE